jgi:hypothetical protein
MKTDVFRRRAVEEVGLDGFAHIVLQRIPGVRLGDYAFLKLCPWNVHEINVLSNQWNEPKRGVFRRKNFVRCFGYSGTAGFQLLWHTMPMRDTYRR